MLGHVYTSLLQSAAAPAPVPDLPADRFNYLATLSVPAAFATPQLQAVGQRLRQLQQWRQQRRR